MKVKLLALLFISVGVMAQNPYYYHKGKRIDLPVDRNCLNVIIKDNAELSSVENSLSKDFTIEKSEKQQTDKMVKAKFKNTPSSSSYQEAINTLKQNSDVKLVAPYFERGDSPIGISDVFYVKLKDAKDISLLEKVAQQQDVRIVKQVPYMPEWYILSLGNSHKTNMLEIPNMFYETGYFEDVDPAFMFNFKPNSCASPPNDPMFSQLWGLNNTTNTNPNPADPPIDKNKRRGHLHD